MGKSKTGRSWVVVPLGLVTVAAACSGESRDFSDGAGGGTDRAGEASSNDPGGSPSSTGGGADAGDSGAAAGSTTGGAAGSGAAGGEATTSPECSPAETRDCYDGAPGTEGVSPCKGGTSTCDDDGRWGPCDGQVVPVTEVCADAIDNDCNGEADDVSDTDGDGWTTCEGDCCELASDCGSPKLVNPGAIDVEHTSQSGVVTFTDDDCSGKAGDSRAPCDQGLAVDDVKGGSAAAAVDVCRSVTEDERSWGLMSAKYVSANGMPLAPNTQVGIEAAFGTHVIPQRGERMLLLSSGHARSPAQADACGSNSCKNGRTGTPPPNFPQRIAGCPDPKGIYDDMALELKLRAPSNATGVRFSYRYWAFAKPGVCDAYMDEFIALVSPAPSGSVNGNVALDATGTPISPKSVLFDVCSGCPGGAADLQGTGFDTWSTTDGPGGATSWLASTSPVKGNEEITVRFIVWDGGDQVMDSSVLIDKVEWLTESGVKVGTLPITAPKAQ